MNRTAFAALACATFLGASLASGGMSASAQDAEPEAAPQARPVPRVKPAQRTEARPPARQQKATVPAKPEPAEAITVPVPGIADLQPINHARNAGAAACVNSVAQASVATVDAPHKAYSSWVTSDPNRHIFQSIAGLDYKNKTAPNAAVVISATPTPMNTCDSTTVQVYPTARPCAALRQELLKDGSLTDELSGMPLIRAKSGFQHLLMPAPGNGCVIVAVAIGVGAPPQAQAATPPAPPPAVAPAQPATPAQANAPKAR